MTKPKTVTAPMLSFDVINDQGNPDSGTHKLNLWVLDVGEFAQLAEHRSFHFGDFKSAGLVYEKKHHGHYATENNIRHASNWAWIEKWMERGLLAEGLMSLDNSKHWIEDSNALSGLTSRDIHCDVNPDKSGAQV